jgi:excisionase family DNA binding protein
VSAATTETYLLVPEVAQRLRESEWTVRALIRRGELRAFRFGRGSRSAYRVAEADLDDFITARRVPVAG